MKFIEAPLAGAYSIELEPFVDDRGLFARTFCQKEFATIGFYNQIVQINYSVTRQKGAIRGLHYQLPPACEIKIIRCIQGAVFDVIVDIRKSVPTYLQWFGMELSKDNMKLVYIPEGFAHGFQALTDNAELIYHHSAFYSPEYERGLRFDDHALAINWPLPVSVISPRDQSYPLIGDNFKGIEI
ncbi:MAG: dTDP-4-dehydrorhamnose 3,5-epimerase [Desulfobacterium sp.]|nr:dTDP-4-dehydrorhamnose 3,5-epimerase [Desulfobacterium sp.]MBU3949775.1 dTDP-4-dehydrorhamnose 3,5-epimerase [Pseudomonadota bacterium]MBU4009612.1 dTDP-4-dehydrorhamnose 3,5-epimerase [Pseudomonadota bacterium]MBU4037324.1 dTDP-4-dehydrorhamnose 3,5-epimerase [Pseudomonadota bacterium]